MTPSACWCCGFPGLRPAAHAPWCERTRAWLAAERARLHQHGHPEMWDRCLCPACVGARVKAEDVA